MSLLTVEVAIDHGIVTPKEPHLLPERGVGILTILTQSVPPTKTRVALPLVRCAPGTTISPSSSELDASLWD